MYSKPIFWALVPMLLAGCIAQSDIQADYMSAESDCHRVARHRVSSMDTEGDTTFVAGSAFSECMRTAGWKVATPKAAGGTVTAGTTVTPPVGPSTSGGVPGGSASGAAARPAPPASDPTTIPAAPVIGPGVQPAPAPAIEAVTPPVGSASPVFGTAPAQPVAAPAQAAPNLSPPSPRLPGEWTSPGDGAPAAYQPAGRPEGITAPQFGSGAGRNF